MGIPNVGVTGVIQDPGLGGVLAKGIGGITQLLQQQQEQQRLQEAEMYRRKLQQDQLKLQQDAAAEQLRGRQQVGQGLTDLMTPQNVSVDVGAATGIPQTATGQADRSIESVLAKMDPQFRAQFLESAQPVVQDRKSKAEQIKQERAIDAALKDLPESIRPAVKMAIRLQTSKLVPSEVNADIYKRAIGSANATPDQIAAMRKKYPEFAQLPDDDVVDLVAQIAIAEAKNRIGILYKPNSGGGGSGGGSPTGMTPQQKQQLASLEKEIVDARVRLNAYNKRSPTAAVTVDPRSGRAFAPFDQGAANKHVADSTLADKRYQNAVAAKRQLMNQVNGVPDDPANLSVPELASMVNEALRTLRADSSLDPATRAEREAAILSEYKRMAVQAQTGGQG